MQGEDRKLAWGGIVTLAVLAAEFAWFLLIGPAEQQTGNTPDHTAYYYLFPWHWDAAGWTACFTLFLTVSTGLLWWQTRRLAEGAEEQSRFVRRDFEASHRPWIKIEAVRPHSFLEFGRDGTTHGAKLEIVFNYRNVGRGVARNLNVAVKWVLSGHGLSVTRTIDGMMAELRKNGVGVKDIVFPNDTTEYPASLIFSKEDVQEGVFPFGETQEPPLFAPMVFICIDYRDVVSDEPHSTVNVYMLGHKRWPGQEIGVMRAISTVAGSITPDELAFTRLPGNSRAD